MEAADVSEELSSLRAWLNDRIKSGGEGVYTVGRMDALYKQGRLSAFTAARNEVDKLLSGERHYEGD